MTDQKKQIENCFKKLLLCLMVLFLGCSLVSTASSNPGGPVDSMKIMTSTATFDPVRPEAARVIASEFKKIGWDVQSMPIEYNQNVQKVLMQHDYDMWLVMMSGQAIRIDPDVFIYKKHHSSQYKKGGYNWEGFSLPTIDELAERQQAAMDPENRQAIVRKAQKIIHDCQPSNVLAYAQMTNAYRNDRIKNLVPMMGEGIGSFWSDINMEVIKGSGYVTDGVTKPLAGLNPVAVKGALQFMAMRMIYDRLFRIGVDGMPKPWAAKSYKLTDQKQIDITLREGMLWHDGETVTAEDVKFTFDYYAKWKSPFFYSSLKNVESVTTTGKYSLKIVLKKPFAPFIPNVLGAIFIIPEHIWKNVPGNTDVKDALNWPNLQPVGSGPFKFVHWNRGRELKLSAFKNHFHPPKVDGIIRTVYGSHDAMAAAIEKGECDRTRYILKPSLIEDLKKHSNITARGYSNHGYYVLNYHTRRPPLNDTAFRKAIAHVIPKDLIIEAILSGYGEPGGSVIAPVNKFWHNPDVKPIEYNPAKARKILLDAGYTYDKKGKLHYPAKQ